MLGTRGAMHACSVLSDSSILPDSSVHGIFQERTLNQVLPCPSPGDLPDPRIKPMSPASPALQVDYLLLSHREFPREDGPPPPFSIMAI